MISNEEQQTKHNMEEDTVRKRRRAVGSEFGGMSIASKYSLRSDYHYGEDNFCSIQRNYTQIVGAEIQKFYKQKELKFKYYNCICNKSYRNQQTLNKHMRVHHGMTQHDELFCKYKKQINKYGTIQTKKHANEPTQKILLALRQWQYLQPFKKAVPVQVFTLIDKQQENQIRTSFKQLDSKLQHKKIITQQFEILNQQIIMQYISRKLFIEMKRLIRSYMVDFQRNIVTMIKNLKMKEILILFFINFAEVINQTSEIKYKAIKIKETERTLISFEKWINSHFQQILQLNKIPVITNLISSSEKYTQVQRVTYYKYFIDSYQTSITKQPQKNMYQKDFILIVMSFLKTFIDKRKIQ